MRYVSTRSRQVGATLSDAVLRGIAPDGGLYVPASFPEVYLSDFAAAEGLVDVGMVLLAPFFADDRLQPALPELCANALGYPAPLKQVTEGTSVLELFHGPTAAFKDYGARFLAGALSRLVTAGDRPITVLVATSGDTGGAVAAACHDVPGLRVVVLYPRGRVSARQEKQLTTWGERVTAVQVRGDFDDCQRLTKEAFADERLAASVGLTSANSINLARLLPQMVYFADSALQYLREEGVAPGYIVPSGNLGNAAACLWARRCGAPIREVVLATNANSTLTRFIATGSWQPRPSEPTLASAMDVGDPSNIERLTHLSGGWAQLRRRLRAVSVGDEEIERQIRRGPERWGEIWDPHTATAIAVREQMDQPDWILVATAHPAKFESVVEPLIGREVPVPAALAESMERDGAWEEIDPTLDELREILSREPA